MMAANKKYTAQILFRTDSDDRIGSGHLRRCLTLATKLRQYGANCIFVSRAAAVNFNNLVAEIGFQLVELPAVEPIEQSTDADATISAVARLGPFDMVVVDHYSLGATWEKSLRTIAAKMTVIDDLADRHHDCDILIDTAPGCDQRYANLVPLHCQQLLGPSYAMLRSEFRQRTSVTKSYFNELRRILISFGGVDAENLTEQAISVARNVLPETDIDVVVTRQFAHLPLLLSNVRRDDRLKIHIDTPNMAELMATADLAIGAAGSTSWERACMGLPSLVVVTASNQEATAKALAASGIALVVSAGPQLKEEIATALRVLSDSPGLRRLMSEAARSAVDGRGVDRVARVALPFDIKVREATQADARAIWEWRNSLEVRVTATDSAEIDWNDHCTWFARKLDDPSFVMLVAQHANDDIGAVRFDIEDCTAIVSIFLAPGNAGRGFGLAALQEGEKWVCSRYPAIRELRADVRTENIKSIALFRSAGYVRRLLNFERRV